MNTTGTITGKIEYAKDNTSTDAAAAEKNVLNIENIQHEGNLQCDCERRQHQCFRWHFLQ